MALVVLETPDSELALMTTVALLEAHGIPCYVRGGGFGGLYPGPQIASYNAKTIMVPAEALDEAQDLIKSTPVEESIPQGSQCDAPRRKGRIRMLLEVLLFGWFIPSSPSSPQAQESEGMPNNRLQRTADP